jgi:cytochrome c oxidase subunit 2
MDAMRRRVLAGGALLLTGVAAGAVAQSGERVVKVRARKFVFEPQDIPLRKGETVVFEFTSADVAMGFYAPDFKVRSDIVPGLTTKLRFTPDRAGTFPFVCDVFCGDGHEDMGGTLVIT